MTRIKYLLLTAICLVCAQAYGQSLLVYHVVGQVSSASTASPNRWS